MKKWILIIGFLSSYAFADISNVEIRNEPKSFGQCLSLDHVGNWGYIPSTIKVTQIDETLKFVIPTINLTCRPATTRNSPVAWAMDLPEMTSNKSGSGEELEMIGVSGLLYEADRLVRANFTTPENLSTIKTYDLNWKIPGLSEKLANLKPNQSLSTKFIFGLRALYETVQAPHKTYESFSGRYGIYVTWTKLPSGDILLKHSLQEPAL